MRSLVLLLISCALCRYFPSEYDLTLLPSTNVLHFLRGKAGGAHGITTKTCIGHCNINIPSTT